MKELSLNDLAQSRGPGQLHDAKFMSAAEKSKVLKNWELFLKSGLDQDKFTQALYHHLIHVAHSSHTTIFTASMPSTSSVGIPH